jgi:hypothetical protein
MLRTRAARAPRRDSGTNPGLSDHRLAGTNGTAINRLAGDRRTGDLGNARPRRGRCRHGGTRRAQFGHQIGPRGHYRTGRRLPGESAGRGRHSGRGARRRRSGRRRRGRPYSWMRPLDNGGTGNRPGHGSAGSGDADAFTNARHNRRQRLPGTGKNLARPRSGRYRGHRPARRDDWRQRGLRRLVSWRRLVSLRRWGSWRRSQGSARTFRTLTGVCDNRRMNGPSCHRRPNGRGRAGRGPQLFRCRRAGVWNQRRRLFGRGGLWCGTGLGARCEWFSVRCGRFRDGHGRLVFVFRHGAVRFRFGLEIGRIESVEPAQLDGDIFVD